MQVAISGLISGALMYFVGKYSPEPQQPSPLHKVKEVQQPVLQTKQLPRVDTFYPDAIEPIIRKLTPNERCFILYSTLHKAPLAVHEILNLATITGDAERRGSFFPDPNILPSKFAVTNEYYFSTNAWRVHHLNRGHMAAAGNYSGNQEQKYSTFTFANTIPQNQYNNQGIWNTFQRYTRSLLKEGKCQTVEIVSGPIYQSGEPYLDDQGKPYENVYKNTEKVMMKNGIVIPPKLYKIIKCNTTRTAYTSGFTFLNEETYDNHKPLAEFETPLQEIENQTGLVFHFKGGPSLTEFDQEGINKTKYAYDVAFYNNLMKDQKYLREMNQWAISAKKQKIPLNFTELTEKIKQLYEEQTEQMKKKSACQQIKQYLYIHKNLFYLENLGQHEEEIRKQIEEKIDPCLKSTEQEAKQGISRILSNNKNRRYKYPVQERLKEKFPSPSQQQSQQPSQTVSENE